MWKLKVKREFELRDQGANGASPTAAVDGNVMHELRATRRPVFVNNSWQKVDMNPDASPIDN